MTKRRSPVCPYDKCMVLFFTGHASQIALQELREVHTAIHFNSYNYYYT